jgi:hypothetical protein
MKPKPDILLVKYSSSALFAYAIAMLLFSLLAIIEGGDQITRVALAVGTGGFFIVAGDLLSLPYPLSHERYNNCEELDKLCEILCKATNLDNHYIDGEKAVHWLNKKVENVVAEKAKCKRSERIERIMFYMGIVSTTVGFSSLLLVRDLGNIIPISEPLPSAMTILSFFLLTLTLILRERGDKVLESVKSDRENVVKITHTVLYPEKYPDDRDDDHQRHNEGEENDYAGK